MYEKKEEEQEEFLIDSLNLEEAINYLTFIESTSNYIQNISKRLMKMSKGLLYLPQLCELIILLDSCIRYLEMTVNVKAILNKFIKDA